jgi:hypothetical protein
MHPPHTGRAPLLLPPATTADQKDQKNANNS